MDMEHAEALEQIEIAAAEPSGLERLMAGDTPGAAAVAGHLAGCPACVAELSRIRRTAAIAREVIASEPDPALRGRTLDFVRAVGRDRRVEGTEPVSAVWSVAPASPVSLGSRGPGRLGWAAAIAAAVVIGVAGFAAGGALLAPSTQPQVAGLALLSEVATTTVHVEAQPDARRVVLAATTAGSPAAGSLLFSATSGELVVVATGLPVEASGQEYGCWVEVDGTRRRLGRMYRGGDVAAWSGPATGLSDLPPGTTFGVSLGPSGGSPDATPVLMGRL
jgi:hypothetical protein